MEFKKKIAILGTAPGSMRDCPFDRDDWEIWGLSERPQDVKRFDRWFEVHNLERKKQKSAAYWDQLVQMKAPLYTAHEHEELPHAILFPKDEITARFGLYFTNTVSWLFAFALLQDPDEIGLWGIDMAQSGEFGRQRPSVEYYLGWGRGLAEARGGRPKIIIPPESDLLKCRRLYGYDDAGDRMAAKIRMRNVELNQRMQQQQAIFEQADRKANMTLGAMSELERLGANGCPDELKSVLASRLDELQGEAQQALAAKQEADRGIHQIKGAQENQSWVAQGF